MRTIRTGDWIIIGGEVWGVAMKDIEVSKDRTYTIQDLASDVLAGKVQVNMNKLTSSDLSDPYLFKVWKNAAKQRAFDIQRKYGKDNERTNGDVEHKLRPMDEWW